MRSGLDDIRYRINILARVVLLAFIAIAVALVYWSIARGPELLSRDDNPRLVEAELRIMRGRILDVNNVVLAETVGPGDELRRVYYSALAGPAVGYYSLRHGTAGVEEGLDSILRGDSEDPWVETVDRELLHRAQIGRDVRLTLDSRQQQAAERLLGDARGGVLLLALPDASVRALASHPGYDPNGLDDKFEELTSDESAPLLNRVTQGQYQPGLMLQPLLLAAAVDRGLIDMTDPVGEASGPVTVNGSTLTCLGDPPSEAKWVDVVQNACPEPMLQLGEELGAASLTGVFDRFGLLRAPDMLIETEGESVGEVENPALAVIGQDLLTISPLQAGLALTTLATGGELPQPYVISGIMDDEGRWQAPAREVEATMAVSARAADELLSSLPIRDGIKEHSALVLAGPEGSMNAWYLGLAPAGEPRYAVVVVVEDSNHLAPAQEIGRSLLKEVMGQQAK